MATNLNAEQLEAVRSPKAVLSVSREEFYGQDTEHEPLELIVKEGMTENICELPEDLQGHVFIVGAVGCTKSYKPDPKDRPFVVEPAYDPDGWVSLINGEGMIYRLDFHQTTQNAGREQKKEQGKAWMATRIVKTPDYYADKAFETKLETNSLYQEMFSSYEDWFLKFRNFGLTRVSLLLGARNYLNTAFLPMKFSNGSERLLVTWDVGRPYEIDPCTLGLVAPIGWNKQWQPLIKENLFTWVFPPLLSAAHPAFDTHTNEMFTVNGSKSLKTILQVVSALKFDVKQFVDRYFNIPLIKPVVECFLSVFWQIEFGVLLLIMKVVFKIKPLGEDFICINRWTGSGTDIEQWQVVDEDNQPLKVLQSLHQMGVTEDYIVLSDSAFKITIEDLLPQIVSQKRWLKYLKTTLRCLRKYISYPQLPYTDLYIIPRAQLKSNVSTVTAKRVRIYPETAHFLVDYQNPDGKITLFAGHTAASDPAEFLHGNDQSYYPGDSETEELKERGGMFVSPMDINRLGCWAIDVEKLKDFASDPEQKQACHYVTIDHFESLESKEKQYLFSLSLYAWAGFQPNQFTDIYWNCWGAWPELLSQFIYEMYKDYKYREMPVKEIVKSIAAGKPANLLRMHADRTSTVPKLTIEDSYLFPQGYFGNSPQFIPRPNTDDPTNGYIVCMVLYDIKPSSDENLSYNPVVDKKCELWIFDGKNLSAGPRYRLSHPRLNMGVTIHTTWLSKLETPPARTDYSVQQDYEDIVNKTGSEAIKKLFEQDIYPHFES